MPPPAWLADEAALDAFIAAWRAGTLPKPEWTHAAHVGVCAWHAWDGAALEAVFAAMKRGITAYNLAVGTANTATSGYHETLTRFWVGVVVAHGRQARAATRLEAVRSAVAAYGTARGLHSEYYGFDVVNDSRARAAWVPPDRRPAPG
ncbi:MAG: hypothetical protein AB7U83_18760 [Vicinamibacterales bacterium]